MAALRDNLLSVARACLELGSRPFVLLALVHLSVLGLRLPLLDALPGWMFVTQPKTLGPPLLLLALACVPALGWLLLQRLRGRPGLVLCALVLLGYGAQQGFAWSEGRGIAGMRDRIVHTGHAEFAIEAAQQPSMWAVATGYEAKLAAGELGPYAHTKPPGQLLFYMATERLARGLAHDSTPAARLEALRDLAAVLWPLLSYAVLVPLFFALRMLVDEATALCACLLYLVVPSVTLMTLNTDQVLFPLLFMLPVYMAARAQRERRAAWAVCAGAALYLGAFVTFPMLLAAPVAAGFAAAVALQPETRGPGPGRALARTGLWAAAGFCALFALFALGLHYDFVTRMRGALLFHARWKQWHGGAAETLYFAWLNGLELAVWAGVPLSVFALAGARRSLLRALRGDSSGLVLPALAATAVLLGLAFFGHTKAESARLWLFLVPLGCALCAAELRAGAQPRPRAALALVLALQWLTVLLTKAGQDFW